MAIKILVYKFYFLSLFLFSSLSAVSQKLLVLDNYGKKRIKLEVGDEIYFKQVDNPNRYNDYIIALRDSSLVISTRNLEMQLKEFNTFYFPNNATRFLSMGTGFIGGGFLFAAAVEPLVSENYYDRGESAIIGASFLASSLIFQAFKWKKFKLNKKRRIRIIDTTFRQRL